MRILREYEIERLRIKSAVPLRPALPACTERRLNRHKYMHRSVVCAFQTERAFSSVPTRSIGSAELLSANRDAGNEVRGLITDSKSIRLGMRATVITMLTMAHLRSLKGATGFLITQLTSQSKYLRSSQSGVLNDVGN